MALYRETSSIHSTASLAGARPNSADIATGCDFRLRTSSYPMPVTRKGYRRGERFSLSQRERAGVRERRAEIRAQWNGVELSPHPVPPQGRGNCLLCLANSCCSVRLLRLQASRRAPSLAAGRRQITSALRGNNLEALVEPLPGRLRLTFDRGGKLEAGNDGDVQQLLFERRQEFLD